MALEKMPRSFWSYTAGKGSLEAEEIEARRDEILKFLKENVPGLLGLGVIGLITGLMILMMFAEFRGFYIIDHFWELFRVR